MESHAPGYRYIHPDQMYDTYQGMESGNTQILFACPRCPGKASFSVPKRVGYCFACGATILLHSRYNDIPIATLLSELPVAVPVIPQGQAPSPDRVDVETRPLSQAAWDYIRSRGIDRAIVERFGLLEETTYHGQTYLAWPTRAGDYELRAISQVDTRWEKITPRGHHKYFSLVNHTTHPTTCIVCEGLFSALAYAQYLPRDDAWYVILNSTSNGAKFVEALATFTAAGVRTFLLALDNDHAGRDMTKALARVLLDAGVQVECHFPPADGDDWNDVLRRGESISTSPTVVTPVGLVTLEAPPAGPAVPTTAQCPLDVHYYEQVLAQHGKVVVAAPCGAGKTLAAADLIAQHYDDGILYVAERVEQLREMEALLLQREVPPEAIGLYAAHSADQRALRQEQSTKAIALLTHARMQTYDPSLYAFFPKGGLKALRRLMIVDESITPLLVLSALQDLIHKFLDDMGLTWDDLGHLEAHEMDRRIRKIDDRLTLYARYPMRRAGIHYQDWTESLPAIDTVVEMRYWAYYQMLYQILAGKYLRRDDDIDVLVPMAPHLTWYALFAQVLVLDATATLTDFLYPDYALLTPMRWNYHQITGAYKVRSSLGDLTKTTLVTHQELFLNELKDHIVPILEEFPDPYIVTYKQLAADVQTVLQRPIQHYGATRGSNAYRTTAAAVLLGAYRPPVVFDQLAQLLFGTRYSPVKMAVAHWIQEAYRTRIRSDAPIKLLVMGEQHAVRLLEETIQMPFSTSSIGGADDPDLIEKIVGQLQSKVQKAVLTQLQRDGSVDIIACAREHTNYDTSKVLRAVRGLLQRYPHLEGHLVMDDTTIRLIAKPAPRR